MVLLSHHSSKAVLINPPHHPEKNPLPNLLLAFEACQAFEASQAFAACQAFAAFRAYRIAACWEMGMADLLEYCQETPWCGAGHCFTIKNKSSRVGVKSESELMSWSSTLHTSSVGEVLFGMCMKLP